MNGEVTCCLMLSMILVDLIAAGQLGGRLVGKRYRVGRCRWYWKVHSSSSSSFFTPIQAPTKCSFGSQHKDTKKFGSRRVIQSFSPKLAILVYWDKWWHTLSEALVHSQGSWLAPRGLGWLPEVLVGSQGSCLAPRSFGAATHCGSLMATFSFQHHQCGFLPITIPCLLLSHRLPSLLAPMFLPKAEDINIDTLASIISERILRESPLTYNMLKEILKPWW